MNCESFDANLDNFIDGYLSEQEREACADHARDCDGCNANLDKARAVLAGLHGLSVPAPQQGLLEELITGAALKNESTTGQRRIAYALAAGIIVSVCVALYFNNFASRHNTLDSVELAIAQPKQVHLLIDAAYTMSNVAVAVSLPENVEIAGFPGKSQLTWFTNLKAGKNRLTIPLIANALLDNSATVIAVISHENKSRQYTIRLETSADGNAELLGKEELTTALAELDSTAIPSS